MVSGYILQAVGIYQSNTGDTRYNTPRSMVFEIDSKHKYEYDFPKLQVQSNAIGMKTITVFSLVSPIGSILPASMSNFALLTSSHRSLTRYSLVGISGIVLSDRLLGTSYGKELKTRFETALEEELSSQDGSILPIRSELTGFTVRKSCLLIQLSS